jgi:hypothetical protein
VREKYKGFYLNAGAHELQHNLGWSPKLIIEKHDGEGVAATEIISARGVYETDKEAVEAALSHGREGIDRGFQINSPVGEWLSSEASALHLNFAPSQDAH